MEALQLALSSHAAGILMDDLDGRKAARQLGLPVIGTIGLLERAAEKGLIKLPETIAVCVKPIISSRPKFSTKFWNETGCARCKPGRFKSVPALIPHDSE